MRVYITLLLFSCFISSLYSQEIEPQKEYTTYAKKVIKRLASESFHGRGYVKKGHVLTAKFIKNEFKNIGLSSFNKSYEQFFPIDVNTFPDHVALYLGNQKLKTGEDFIVHATCPSYNRKHPVVYLKKIPKKPCTKYAGKFVVVSEQLIAQHKNPKEARKYIYQNYFSASAVAVIKEKKLTHSYAQKQSLFPLVEILADKMPNNIEEMHLIVDAELKKNVQAENVVGYIPGTEKPDSFIVFTAHYDHLGRMGSETYFPGANDNASGVAMLLSLARYFKEHPAKYSVAFIGFGAEEVGLLGSSHYVKHPLFPLNKIHFLTNLDIFGTGEEGIQIVNGSIHTKAFDQLVNINERNDQLIKQIKPRGEAANSDHYPFHKKGVPAIFIYTLGGIKAYHDIYDKAETLPLTEFEDLFKLLAIFVNELHG